jgi:hypothetical protein
MITITQHTNTGIKVNVNAWKANNINFSIFIEDEEYDSGTTIDNDIVGEAKYWARVTVADIENGRLKKVNGRWFI